MLLDSLIIKLSQPASPHLTIDRILNLVEQHPQLESERAVIRRYTDAYPELIDTVSTTRRRVESALTPFEFQRKFRFTKGLHC